ncbi:MAG: aspartate--ammonia ligase [Chitinophagaceae bacterium]
MRETEIAIKKVKDFFEKALAYKLNLTRVTAPLFLANNTGLNDNLNGLEEPVNFLVNGIEGRMEIVHSLAKWKRMALHKYQFSLGEGLYTDMNAIRKEEDLDHLHSLYVDQWDYEIIIDKKQRNINFLKQKVCNIYEAFLLTELYMAHEYPDIIPILPKDIFFITTQELEDKYPQLSPKAREEVIIQEKKAVFLMKIGKKLQSGVKHDNRSPDYDDWELNGDILLYHPILEGCVELSSMGIRVDNKALEEQLKLANATERKKYAFHQMILKEELPFSIGGGIGQSRICMFFLRKLHVGEVQASVWPQQMLDFYSKKDVVLL